MTRLYSSVSVSNDIFENSMRKKKRTFAYFRGQAGRREPLDASIRISMLPQLRYAQWLTGDVSYALPESKQ
jgi:hypothetical protein